jgi:hypothetical protein
MKPGIGCRTGPTARPLGEAGRSDPARRGLHRRRSNPPAWREGRRQGCSRPAERQEVDHGCLFSPAPAVDQGDHGQVPVGCQRHRQEWCRKDGLRDDQELLSWGEGNAPDTAFRMMPRFTTSNASQRSPTMPPTGKSAISFSETMTTRPSSSELPPPDRRSYLLLLDALLV